MEWFLAAEQHIQFGGFVIIATWLAKKYRVDLEIKRRLNTLWFDRCAARQEPYQPVENGTPPILPPRPVYSRRHLD
jgi:hypothetical protein